MALHFAFFPEQEIHCCDLHLALSTGSHTPGWDSPVVFTGFWPSFHTQLGSPGIRFVCYFGSIFDKSLAEHWEIVFDSKD